MYEAFLEAFRDRVFGLPSISITAVLFVLLPLLIVTTKTAIKVIN